MHVNTVREWRARYAGMTTSELAQMRKLTDENSRLQRIVSRQALELDAVRELIEKNGWGPQRAAKR